MIYSFLTLISYKLSQILYVMKRNGRERERESFTEKKVLEVLVSVDVRLELCVKEKLRATVTIRK